MPNVSINVKISGKWTSDASKAKRLLSHGAMWIALGAGTIWLVAGGQVLTTPYTGTPENMPICRSAPTANGTTCAELHSGSHD